MEISSAEEGDYGSSFSWKTILVVEMAEKKQQQNFLKCQDVLLFLSALNSLVQWFWLLLQDTFQCK